jgi:uncharacterized membrane protein YkvI
MNWSNQPDAVNPAMALRLATEGQWRRVTDLERWHFMSSTSPTVRGVASIVVAVGSLLILPALRPALIVESGVGTFAAEPVGIGVWIVGGILLLACVAITLEAFRRGSSSDKICASIAAVLTLILAVQYFGLSSLKTKKFNQAVQRRPAAQSDGSDNLSAIVAADRAFPAAVLSSLGGCRIARDQVACAHDQDCGSSS